MNPLAPTIPRTDWIDRSDRVRIDISGPDRAKFLHNLVTNDVKKLVEGHGCEAFVTTPQGKTLAYVSLAASGTSILLRSDVGEAETFLGHLQKYGIFEAVAIEDVSDQTFEIHVLGPIDDANLNALADVPLANVQADWAGHSLRFVREAPAGHPGWTIVGPIAVRDAVVATFAREGLGEAIDPAAFEAMRIEAGTPVSGRDVTPSNLPQEVGRDRATISFVKGCYLGQETVARLDALGHVNKLLKGLRIEGPSAPVPGASLTAGDGKPAGLVTSSAPLPGRDESVALAYVRVAHAVAGTPLTIEVDGRPTIAVVADLPMKSPSQ